MIIKNIISQHRRDFTAIYMCEHCNSEYKASGYDDANYHNNILPKIVCINCGKMADENYRPLTTKYAEHEII